MLAELAAANAAFGVIKQAIANGRELASVGKQISTLVQSEDELRERGHKKHNSIFSKLLGKDTADIDEFMALEDINKKKDELRELMQLYGRAGIWNDWVKFQAEARKRRQKEKKEREELIATILKYVMIFVLIAVLAGGAFLIVYTAMYLKGR